MKLLDISTIIDKPSMFFIGVTTHNSFINKVFEHWLAILNKNIELIGVNLELNCDPKEYQLVLDRIERNPFVLGALVTTHKVRIFNHCKEYFNNLPKTCHDFKEIGCIYKEGPNLQGEVTDLYSVKDALKALLENKVNDFKSDIYLLGCGGAGLALAYVILSNEIPNYKRLIISETDPNRCLEIEAILEKYNQSKKLQIINTHKQSSESIVSGLEEGSLIVNATGLGKDKKGSPIQENTKYPSSSILWDFNYRGELEFLTNNLKLKDKYNLQIEDGWIYFINGWSQVLKRVTGSHDIFKHFNEFKSIADSKREKTNYR